MCLGNHCVFKHILRLCGSDGTAALANGLVGCKVP